MKTINTKELSQVQYEVLADYLRNNPGVVAFDTSVSELMVAENGDIYQPIDYRYDSNVCEVHGSMVDMGEWYATDYGLAMTAQEFIEKTAELDHEYDIREALRKEELALK